MTLRHVSAAAGGSAVPADMVTPKPWSTGCRCRAGDTGDYPRDGPPGLLSAPDKPSRQSRCPEKYPAFLEGVVELPRLVMRLGCRVVRGCGGPGPAGRRRGPIRRGGARCPSPGGGCRCRGGTVNPRGSRGVQAVSYTHLRAHETRHDLVCRLLLEKKK